MKVTEREKYIYALSIYTCIFILAHGRIQNVAVIQFHGQNLL